MIGADRDPLSFHFESLNQGLALPLPGGNLRCRSTPFTRHYTLPLLAQAGMRLCVDPYPNLENPFE
jgi:hypothetical protein